MKEQIQKKIRQNLDEAEMTPVKRNMAKILGLKHAAFNTWKDKTGDSFIWSDSAHTFVKSENTKTLNKNGNLEFRDKVEIIPKDEKTKEFLKGNRFFKVNDVKEDGDASIPRLKGKRGYQLRSTDNSKPLMLIWLQDGGDSYFDYKKVEE